MIGRQISHYTILEKLGDGGMGIVYKAQDTKLKRTVALKFLRGAAFESKEQRERFVREAQTAAALDHPSICTVYEIEEVDDQTFISMAYVEGVDLKELLQSGPLDIDKALDITIQVGRGLEAAHRKGIVHRDIKCSNIMVTDQGGVKITDFGLATMPGGTEISKTTRGVGTPSYMSPEQAGGKTVDHRTDIWSLGVCLYEMLTGELPFTGDYDAAVAYSILNVAPRPLRELRPEVPIELESVLAKAMMKSPEDRYQEMAEFLTDLESPTRATALNLGALAPWTKGGAPSVAVMPFADMSPHKDQEYFCDGIAEEITNRLGCVEGLRVAARTSAFAYKNRIEDIREIGVKLGVSAILEGGVRKAGNQIRITGQLVNVADGYHLWTGQYDRELEDVFAIQDEIACNIVDALSVTLSEQERREIGKPTTGSVEAYDYYLRGRKFFHRVHHKSMGFARQMFTQAIGKDPRFALAYAGTADCFSYLYLYFERKQQHLVEAMSYSKKALELDPELAEAHAAYGLAVSLDERYDEAEREFEKAIELNPRLFEAYFFYARTCFGRGEVDRSAELFEKASLANPEDYQTPILLAQSYRVMGDVAKQKVALNRALEVVDRHLDMNPDDVRAMYMKATAHVEMGDREEGLKWMQRTLEIEPKDPITLYGVACLYSRTGKTEDAVCCLEKSVEAGFSHKGWIENDPDMDALRGHPKYLELMKRLS